MKRSESLRAERLQALSKARNLARSRVAVDDALGSGAHQLRLSCVERFLCCFLVAQCQRFLDLAKEGANARAAVLVDRSAAGDFSRSLLGRRRVGHGASLSKLMSML